MHLQDDLFSGILRMTGNRADAEDLAQETFIRAYRALQGYPPGRIRQLRLRGWLWTIAINLCRNRAGARSRKPETFLPEGFEPAGTGFGTGTGDAGSRWWTASRQAVEALPAAQREAVVLRHVVGLPYAEIAEAVERPVGTVKAEVHRALVRLRQLVPSEETR